MAAQVENPYYTRKRVPKELTVGLDDTGLDPEEEFAARERKLSNKGHDLRKFSSWWTPSDDPLYARKPVPKRLINGVAPTGLSPEEEFENRERKLSNGGDDLRRFSNALTPSSDPFYNRKPVPKKFTKDVGETALSPEQEYNQRERKMSMFQGTPDPFEELTGRRASTAAGLPGGYEGEGRRRSSAVAPDHVGPKHHFDGGHLAPIMSRPEQPDTNDLVQRDLGPTDLAHAGPSTTTTTHTATKTETTLGQGYPVPHQHELYHDAVTGGSATSEGTTAAGSENA